MRVPFAVPAVALLMVVCAATTPLTGGCDDQRCRGSENRWDSPERGGMLNVDTWESGPIEGNWLPFTHQRLIHFRIPNNQRVLSVTSWVSTVEKPVELPQKIFVIAAGNLAVMALDPVDRSRFDVRNDTCADYYVRVEATVGPPGDEDLDASRGGDADSGDGGDASFADADAADERVDGD